MSTTIKYVYAPEAIGCKKDMLPLVERYEKRRERCPGCKHAKCRSQRADARSAVKEAYSAGLVRLREMSHNPRIPRKAVERYAKELDAIRLDFIRTERVKYSSTIRRYAEAQILKGRQLSFEAAAAELGVTLDLPEPSSA